MKNTARHGRRLAVILLALFAASWLLRATHGLVLHTDHHDRPVCEAAHDGGNQAHLHDQRYTPDNCPVCAFWFSIPELFSVTAMVKPKLAQPAQVIPQYEAPARPDMASDSVPSRGPPVM